MNIMCVVAVWSWEGCGHSAHYGPGADPDPGSDPGSGAGALAAQPSFTFLVPPGSCAPNFRAEGPFAEGPFAPPRAVAPRLRAAGSIGVASSPLVQPKPPSPRRRSAAAERNLGWMAPCACRGSFATPSPWNEYPSHHTCPSPLGPTPRDIAPAHRHLPARAAPLLLLGCREISGPERGKSGRGGGSGG